jgi:predicted oxidoreductase
MFFVDSPEQRRQGIRDCRELAWRDRCDFAEFGPDDVAESLGARRGMRIGPQPLVSGFDTRRLVTAICAQERPNSWQLMNRCIALKELAISGAEYNPSIREKRRLGFLRDILLGNHWLLREMLETCADFVIGATLPELVEKNERPAGRQGG